jgi:hypothetical protein
MLDLPVSGSPHVRPRVCLIAAVRRRSDTHDEMQPRYTNLCERLGTERDAHRRQVDLVRASLLAKPTRRPAAPASRRWR